MALTSQQKPTRYFILILAISFVAWSVYQEFRPQMEVGQLEYRMISGTKDNSFEVIMIETARQYTVMDEEFKGIIENNDAELISRPEQLQLLQAYKNLEYRVSISNKVKNQTAQYRLSRENFNTLQFNETIKFEIDRKVRDSIVSLVEM